MADEKNEKEESKEAKPSKKFSWKIIVIVIVLLAAVGGGGFFAWSKLSQDEDKDKDEAVANGPKKTVEEKVAEESGQMEFLNLDPFVVNLTEEVGTTYLKMTVVLEMGSQAAAEEAKVMMPKLRDAIIVLLSSKKFAEIGTIEGKYGLRDEIVARINHILSNGKVKTAYFTEFIVQ